MKQVEWVFFMRLSLGGAHPVFHIRSDEIETFTSSFVGEVRSSEWASRSTCGLVRSRARWEEREPQGTESFPSTVQGTYLLDEPGVDVRRDIAEKFGRPCQVCD